MSEAHKTVAATTKGIEALQKLEELLASTLGEVLTKRETAMADLHRSQSEEMNRACSSDNENPEISSLVAKHIKQMELEERKWEVRLTRMRKDQKKFYVRCLLRWSEMAVPPTVSEVVMEYNNYEQALFAVSAGGPADKAGGAGGKGGPGGSGGSGGGGVLRGSRAIGGGGGGGGGGGSGGGDAEGLRGSAASDKKKKGWWGKKTNDEAERYCSTLLYLNPLSSFLFITFFFPHLIHYSILNA